MKPCSGCGVPKELSDFYKNKASKDGHTSKCKSCKSEVEKEWREANKERKAEYNQKWYEVNKERRSEYDKKWYEANKERKAEYNQKWYETNKEHCSEYGKKWRGANKENIKARDKKYSEINKQQISRRGKKWTENNPAKRRSSGSKRRSIKLQAYPQWAATLEKRQIEEIYTLAKIQGEATGKEYHVDHIHPLQAPKVVMFEGEMIPLICGLHVPANLQILEASVNCSKNNKFEPYIESECDFTELWQVRSNDRAPKISTHKPKAAPMIQLALF